MSKLRLHGTSSGHTDIAPTAAAGNNTLTAPTGTGTIVIQDGNGAVGVTSVRATNANFSGTTRITSGISTTLNITTSNITTLRATTGISTTAVINTAKVGAAVTISSDGIDASGIGITCQSLNGASFGSRNLWINGDASIAQRGVQQTSVTSISGYATGGPDRQFSVISNHGTWTIKQGTDAPPGFGNCYEFLATTGDGSVASDASVRWWQRFEGKDLQRFAKGSASAKPMALSFWIKSSTTGTYAFEMLDYDSANRNCVKTYTVDAADTWEWKSIIFPGDTTGAFAKDNNLSLAAEFWLVAGSDYTSNSTGAGTWGTMATARRAPGHTANAGASNNDYVRITGIQLEVGNESTSYEHKTYQQELAACQRYYEEGAFSTRASGTVVRYFQAFNTTKRVNPTVDVYYDVNKATSGTINSGNSNNSGWNESGMTSGWNMEKNTGSNGDGVDFAGWYTASAEL